MRFDFAASGVASEREAVKRARVEVIPFSILLNDGCKPILMAWVTSVQSIKNLGESSNNLFAVTLGPPLINRH